MENKYRVGTNIKCVSNDYNCDNLITIEKTYKVIEYQGKQLINTVYIITDVGARCHLPIKHFNALSEIRKEKLKIIYENNKVQI